MRTFEVPTTENVQLIDITEQVRKEVGQVGVQEGICTVVCPHTTAGLFVNEADSGLLQDIKDLLNMLAPAGKDYRHNHVDPNAEAHLRKILTGRSATITISSGELQLGTWEHIILAEYDGPRKRTVQVQTLGS